VIKAPELWGGGFEAKTNFGSAAHEPLAQTYGHRQSNETTVSTEYNCARRIGECSFVSCLALHDHRQLRMHSL